MRQRTSWLVRRFHNPAAVARLFCIPYAGGGASCYRTWPIALAPLGVETIAIQPPGREARLKEQPYDAIAPLADAIASHITVLLDRAYFLFGHSMGALVAFETARRLAADSKRQPERLILSSANPPHLMEVGRPLHRLGDAELLRALTEKYGGPAAEVFECPELARLIVPVLRADLMAVETYRTEPGLRLACPVTVWSGSEDKSVNGARSHEWARYTDGAVSVQVVRGGHFGIFRDSSIAAHALSLLTECLSPIARSSP